MRHTPKTYSYDVVRLLHHARRAPNFTQTYLTPRLHVQKKVSLYCTARLQRTPGNYVPYLHTAFPRFLCAARQYSPTRMPQTTHCTPTCIPTTWPITRWPNALTTSRSRKA